MRSASAGSTRVDSSTAAPSDSGTFSRAVTSVSPNVTSATRPSASACSMAL
jgi:hypothetical protein